jgi:triacylglycerol esterase/lipase EstA (alpha/beta hydrolase family)
VRVLVVVIVVVLQVGRCLPAAAGEPSGEAVRYVAPVPGEVVDPWREATTPFGSGNRGIDLFAESGDVVRAAASGVVVFAGTVAGSHHVVVLHPDGLRTTYAFLASTLVQRGDRVVQGQPVGTAAGPVHFGVRAGDEYLDPMRLLVGPPVVHLVPTEARRPDSEAGERRGLVGFLGGAIRAGSAATAWLTDHVATGVEAGLDAGVGAGIDLVEWTAREGWPEVERRLEELVGTADRALRYLRLPVEFLVAMRQMRAYQDDQAHCTPPDRSPPRLSERHIAVLVAGFGSSGHGDSIGDLDTRSLGYADADVAQFSYAGGEVAQVRHLDGVTMTDGYSVREADGDLNISAGKLRQMLEEVQAANPGVPVDVIAHSQGGLVARAALADRGVPDPRLPEVANLITIGTPHTGADAATAIAWIGSSDVGEAAATGIGAIVGQDPFSPAAGQMVEGSPFLRELADGQALVGRFTSIASAGDLVVTANHSAVGAARNALVPGGPGFGVHGGLPGTDAVAREVALALAALGPTCRSLGADMAQVALLSTAEDVIGFSIGLGFSGDPSMVLGRR